MKSSSVARVLFFFIISVCQVTFVYISEGAEIDKAYWNIGVRIEDDVLVTEDGHKLLSHKAPSEIADIEKIMKEENKLFSILD